MTRLMSPVIRVLALVALTAGLVACGGGSSSSGGGQSSAASGSGGTSSGTAITIKNFSFMPDSLTVAPGAMVTVTNQDSAAHTVTDTATKMFDTGNVAGGQAGTFTAPSKAGSYPYICTIHVFMKGTLVVKS